MRTLTAVLLLLGLGGTVFCTGEEKSCTYAREVPPGPAGDPGRLHPVYRGIIEEVAGATETEVAERGHAAQKFSGFVRSRLANQGTVRPAENAAAVADGLYSEFLAAEPLTGLAFFDEIAKKELPAFGGLLTDFFGVQEFLAGSWPQVQENSPPSLSQYIGVLNDRVFADQWRRLVDKKEDKKAFTNGLRRLLYWFALSTDDEAVQRNCRCVIESELGAYEPETSWDKEVFSEQLVEKLAAAVCRPQAGASAEQGGLGRETFRLHLTEILDTERARTLPHTLKTILTAVRDRDCRVEKLFDSMYSVSSLGDTKPDPNEPGSLPPTEPEPDEPGSLPPTGPDPNEPGSMPPTEPDPNEPKPLPPTELDPYNPGLLALLVESAFNSLISSVVVDDFEAAAQVVNELIVEEDEVLGELGFSFTREQYPHSQVWVGGVQDCFVPLFTYLDEKATELAMKSGKEKSKALLVAAARLGYLGVVQEAVSSWGEGILRSSELRQALMEAAENGHLSILKHLVGSGAIAHARDGWALLRAAENGDLPMVKYLVGCGANANAKDQALMEAAKNGHLSIVKYLVVECGVSADTYGGNALVEAAWNGHLSMVEYLIECWVRAILANLANAQDKENLVKVIRNGHLSMAKYLFGSRVHRDAWRTALVLAADKGHLSMIEYLVECGVPANAGNGWALVYAGENGHLSMAKYLVEHGVSAGVRDGKALKSAERGGHRDVADYLRGEIERIKMK